MLERLVFAVSGMVAMTVPAFAHLDPGNHGSLLSGLSHPLFGLDHIVAMVAVGFWAATIGGRAVWIVPGAFVGAMMIGYVLSVAGKTLPFVEPMIFASVVTLGLTVAAIIRLPVILSAMIAGIFALFHGHAHRGELGAAAAPSFGIGLAIATALLHTTGIGLGRLLNSVIGIGKMTGETLSRVFGVTAIAVSLALAFASG